VGLGGFLVFLCRCFFLFFLGCCGCAGCYGGCVVGFLMVDNGGIVNMLLW